MSDSQTPSERLRAAGLYAKKAWGQNFLHDRGIQARIAGAAAAGMPEGARILEIGAGLGDLTQALIATGKPVLALERDRDLIPLLEARFAEVDGFELVAANALTFELPEATEPWSVVGNLPYHISSKIIFHMLGFSERWRQLTVMLQRELADRALARGPGKNWSAFGARLARRCEVRLVCSVPSGAFTPAPRVESTVVQLVPRDPGDGLDEAAYDRAVHLAFAKRRKTLRNNLRSTFDNDAAALDQLFVALDVPPAVRGEALTIDQLADLARRLPPA
jgi:16S rRNA (adenine1518-N6/adenine1519-N6)-dimethyltransferase